MPKGGSRAFQVVSKLKAVATSLKPWSRHAFAHTKERILSLEHKLGNLQKQLHPSQPLITKEEKVLRAELNQLLEVDKLH